MTLQRRTETRPSPTSAPAPAPALDPGAGRFEGYASVFNIVDRGRDMVLPGAFRASLAQRGAAGIKFLWQHDPREPIGILEELREDGHGLYVRGRLLLDVARAREAHGLMTAGALDGLSIGFHARRADRARDGTRRLRELDLWEISLVTFPMNERARIFSLKQDRDISELAADQAAFLAGLRHLTHLMTLESKEALENLTRHFEAFKAANDERLAELEGKGRADGLTEEKMDRLDAELSRLQTAVNRLHRAAQRPGLDQAPAAADDAAKAFYDGFIRKGQMPAPDRKSLNTALDAEGGFAVPVELDRSLEKRLRDLSPVRAECQVVNIGTADYKKLVNLGGVTSGWVSETAARPETDAPQLAEVTPPLGEIYANPAATQTMLDDAYFDVEAWLAEELAEEFALQENAAFVTGDGLNKPKGFLTYATNAAADGARPFGQIQTLATGVSGDWPAADPSDVLIDLVHSLRPGYRAGGKFYLNTALLAEIRKFKDVDGNYLWRPGLESGMPQTLLGYPVVEVADMPDKGANSLSVAFANMKRAYTVTDRLGTRILRDPFSQKPYVHFYTTKRVGGAVTNDQAIKLLQFAL